MFTWKQVELNIASNELQFIGLKNVDFTALHRTRLMCIALHYTVLMQK